MSRDIGNGPDPQSGSGSFDFSWSCGSAWGSSRAVVSAFGIDGECADDLAGDGVDDAYVMAPDEEEDGGSVEGSSDADVVHVAVDAQADVAGVDSVAPDAELAVEVVVAGSGLGAGLVSNGWRRAVRE